MQVNWFIIPIVYPYMVIPYVKKYTVSNKLWRNLKIDKQCKKHRQIGLKNKKDA